MAKENKVMRMYGDFCRFLRDAESNEFYTFFQKSVQNSSTAISIFEKYVERRIDMRWLVAIENVIIPIDSIIRKPNTFIKREESIIPIAQARNVGPESVRHLAQHTNLISSVEGDKVTPSKVLNITKDDSIETYENRFIYTLLRNAQFFLDKRVNALMKDTKRADLFEYQIEGNGKIGQDNIEYRFKMHMETPHEQIDEDEQLINADVSTMDPLQRIERLRKILYTFQGSPFCQALRGTLPVRSPLVMTNVLKKNPNFIKAVQLWNFINSYDELGYSSDYIEQYRSPSDDDRAELFAIVMLEYVMMKKQCRKIETEEEYNEAEISNKEGAPFIITRSIEELIGHFNFTVDEVRRVFEKELHKKEKKTEAEFAKARGVFSRAISFEKENDRLNEIRRRERVEKEIRRRLALAVEEAKEMEQELPEEQQTGETKTPFFAASALYHYSFQAHLILGQKPIQDYYTEIKNHLLSYQNVKSKMAWQHESFRQGRSTIAKLSCRGKTLCMTLAMDPMQFAESKKYRIEAVTERGKSSPNAARVRVKSSRSLKYAKELIDLLMMQYGLSLGTNPGEDYHMPFQPVEELLNTNPPLVHLSKWNHNEPAPEDSSIEPVAEPEEKPVEESVEEKPAEEPVEEPVEEPAEEPAKEPTEEPAEEPAEEAVEEPAEEPAEEAVEEPAEEPAEEAVEEPIEETAEETVEEPAEESVETIVAEPVEEPAVEATEEPVEEPAEEPEQEPEEEFAEESEEEPDEESEEDSAAENQVPENPKKRRSYKGVDRKKKKKMQKEDGVFEQYRRKNQREAERKRHQEAQTPESKK